MRLTLFIVMVAMLAGPVVTGSAVAEERKPLDCLNNRSIKATRFTPDGYYARSGKDWWLNRAGNCGMFRQDLSIATISPLNRQCRGDQVRLFQNFTGIEFGTCTLGAWEPVDADVVPPPGIARKTDK